MPDSDWSCDEERNEELTKKRQHKKSKHTMIVKDRKRKHSNNVESNDVERPRKKKSNSRKESNDNVKEDIGDKFNKNKSKYNSLENQDFSYKRKESENRYPSLDSDPENEDRRTQSKSEKRQDDRKSKSNRYSSKDGSKKYSHDNYSTMELEYDKSKSKSNKNNHEDSKRSNHNKKSNNYDSLSDSDHEERKLSSSSNKQKVSDDNFKKPSSKKKRKYSKTSGDDQISDHDQRSESYPRITEDGSKDAGYYSERKSSKTSREKNSNRNKYDDSASYERYEKGSLPLNEDDDDKYSSNSEKPYRYWSSSRGPVRKNSDSYWNKYSDRLKEPTEHVEVGPRYYSGGENVKKDKSDNEGIKDKQKDDDNRDNEIPKEVVTPKQKKTVDLLTSKTGGAYIPPAKLRMMQESITDKASAAYQRLAWEALKKSIQGHVNKVNIANMKQILKAVQKENIVRGRGLLCRALIQAQAASPSFTNVYAAFVAVLNAKFPKIGELLLKRLVVQFRRGFKRNDKTICITAATFIAHLVNQEVAHEIIALEILTLLIETPTDDSVEVAIAFMKECGMKLSEVSNKGIMGVFDLLRNILHEGKLEKRVQYMIEVMFQVRKENFNAHPSLIKELDLVDEEDRIQHMITLEENHNPEDILNVFKFDPDYEANEAKYKALVDVEGDEESGEEGSSGSGDSEDESDEEDEEGQKDSGVIVDKTETNLVALRKTIYLTIQSSLDFEECAHKLLRMELKPGQEIEMAHMFLDCCAEQRTYEKFYGLLSQRFCQINRSYVGPFEETFRDSYTTIHRMSNDKLRNVGKLFAHLLYTDAISWEVLSTIRLNEDDTTSSSRIFIKILFLELSEYMGLAKLNQRVKDPSLQVALEGLFPRDNPKHTRFAINFFTSIGLGGLTDELREHLKAQPKQSIVVPQLVEGLSSSSSSDSSSDSSDSSDSSSDSSSSESSSSESEDSSRNKKKKSSSSKKKQASKISEKEKSLKKRKNSPPKRKKDR